MINSYAADPGGYFDSDAHRHVLGHLSLPTDDYGWSIDGLALRVSPAMNNRNDLVEVFGELIRDGLADSHGRMTQKGFDALHEPVVDEGSEGPAVITMAVPIVKE